MIAPDSQESTPGKVRLARLLTFGALATAVLALAGVVTGVAPLATFLPGRAPISIASSLVAIAVALAQLLLVQAPRGPVRVAGRLLAVTALLLAAMALLDFVQGGRILPPIVWPGRAPLDPSPTLPGAVGVLLASAAVLLLDVETRRGRRPAELLAALAGLLAFVTLTAHAYSAESLYRRGALTSISIPAALAIALLAMGTLAARSRHGVMRLLGAKTPSATFVRRLLALAVLAPPLLGMLVTVLTRLGWPDLASSHALLVAAMSALGISLLISAARRLAREEQERAAAEAKFHTAIEHAPDGVLLIDRDGRVRLANVKMEGLLGKSRREILGARAGLLLPGADEPGLRELELRGPAGTKTIAEVESVPLEKDDITLLVYVRDVTLRRRAEAELARLASIIESTNDAVFLLDGAGTVLSYNAGAERMFGYTREEIVGLPASDMPIFPPERRLEPVDLVARLQRGEAVPPYETERVSRDGRRLHLSVSVSRVHTPEGRFIGYSIIGRDITARRRVVQALRASEESFRALVQHASDGIFIADETGRYTEVNGAGCKLLDARREEIVGRTILDFIRHEDRERLAREREQVLAGRTEMNEWLMRRGDGSWVEVEVSTCMLPDGRWLGLTRDITRRKQAERELREAHETERRVRRQLDAMSSAAKTISDALAMPEVSTGTVLGLVVEVSRQVSGAAFAAFGAGGDDPGRPFESWIASPSAEALPAPRPTGVFGQVAQGRLVRAGDVRVPLVWSPPPHGPPATTSFLGVPVQFRGRRIGSLFLLTRQGEAAFTEDDENAVRLIADRAAAALEAARLYEGEALQRAWLDRVLEQLPEGVVLLDETGRNVRQNVAAQRLNRTGGDQPSFDLRRPDGTPLPPDRRPLMRAWRGETVTGEEYRVVDREGRPVPVLASAAPVRDLAGRIAGATLVLKDVTAFKDLERLREEWISVIAHDLRQPVSTLRLVTELLGREPLPSRGARLVQRAATATRRLSRMIDDLLDASRLEAKRLRLDLQPVSPEKLLLDVVEDAARLFEGTELRVEPGPDLPPVRADQGRLEQVLNNLVSNAVRYGDPGSPVVLAAHTRNGEVEFSVTNHGSGIDESELKQLFQRFRRAPSAEAGPHAGLGLGLYIAAGLVEAHGGRLRAESVPGETTTFRFNVPVAERAERGREAHDGPPAAP